MLLKACLYQEKFYFDLWKSTSYADFQSLILIL